MVTITDSILLKWDIPLKFVIILILGQFSIIEPIPSWRLKYYCLDSNKDDSCLDKLQLFANPLISLNEFNPIGYDDKLFCTVDNKNATQYKDQTMGQSLLGDRLQYIPYNFKFNHNVTCEKVCKRTINDKKDFDQLINIVSKTYSQRWYGDSVPVVYCHMVEKKNIRFNSCTAYFLVGCGIDKQETSDPNIDITKCAKNMEITDKFVVFNHLVFTITYKEEKIHDKTYAQIIHINVDITNAENRCDGNDDLKIFDKSNEKNKLPATIDYSYSVQFVKNNSLSLTNRWDYMFYSSSNNQKNQWLYLCVIIVIFVIFTVGLGLNFYNLLKKDIIRYTQLIDNAQLDIQDEYGWKVLRGDVFRPPKFPLILATSVGCGIQLISMVMVSLLFAAIGLYSSHTHNALITCVVVFFIIFGIVSGYVSARLYKFFGGIRWKMCVIGTALIHPGIMFMMIHSVNFWLWIYNSPSAIKPLILIGLFFIWVLISVPLSFLGSFIGFRQRIIQSPVKINHIPRFIPRQELTTNRIVCIIFGGLPTFICLFWQLYFLIKSVWARIDYAMFHFLFVAAFIAIIVCAEVAILLGYMHLSSEDYRWQWRSFFTTASTSFYCLLVVIYYYTNSNVTGSLGTYAYFTYSLVILYMLALALGSVGFLSCFFVFLKMYSSIKVD